MKPQIEALQAKQARGEKLTHGEMKLLKKNVKGLQKDIKKAYKSKK